MGKIKFFALTLAAGIFFLLSNMVRGQAPTGGEMESILDRLESRLVDQESETLSFDEKRTLKSTDKGPTTKYKFKGDTLKGSSTEEQRLKQIATNISKLEDEIEHLANDVQSAKQKAMENAKIDNYVEIDAAMLNTDDAGIKTLHVKLDGYPIYELNDAAGLWMPAKSIPLYSGPLSPGKHDLDIEVRVVLREKDSLPLNKSVYRNAGKRYAIEIPNGIVKKKFVVEVTPPDKNNKDVATDLKTIK